MPDNSTTITFKANISDLKKNIQEANRQIKVANAEFKAASAGMDNWSKSADGLSAKISATQKTLSAQKTILGEYKKQLELVEQEYGKNSKEADEMRIKVLNQEAAVKKTESALKGYESELKKIEKETKASGSAYEELGKKIEGNEKKLEELKKEYASVVMEQGKGSKAAKELAKEIGDLSKELVDDKKAFEDAGKAADGLDKSLDDTGKAAANAGNMAAKAGDGFTVMKGILADLAAGAIRACVQGLKDLAAATADAWKEFDEGRDTVIKLTGATGDMAKQMTTSFSNVSKSVKGDTADIANAVGEVNTRWGLTGKALEDMSAQYVKFADITGADVISSVNDTQKALSAYGKGVNDVNGFLDTLTATAQKTGVSTSTLTSGIISNATAFQEMGLTLEQAVGFMGQLEKSGVNLETVTNGMRKALKNSAKDGKSLDESLLALQATIEGNGDSTKGLQAAYDLFGKSGDQIYGAIKNGTLSFKDLTAAMQSSAGAVNNTYNETLDATDKLKLKFKEVKITLAESFDSFLQENSPQIEKAIDDIGGAIVGAIPSIKGALDTLVPYITDFMKNELPSLIDKVKTELPSLIDTVVKKIPEVIRLILEITPKVMELVNSILDHKDAILGVIKAIVGALAAGKIISIISKAVTAFQTFFGVIKAGKGVMLALNAAFALNPITLIIAGITALVAAFIYLWNNCEEFRDFWINLWEGIKDACKKAWEAIKGFFAGAGDFFKGVWESIKAAFSAVGEFFKTIFSLAFENAISRWKTAAEFYRNIWEAIKAVFAVVGAFFKEKFDTAYENVKAVWNGAVEFFKGIWEKIKSVFGNVKDWFRTTFEGARDAVKNVFNGIGEVIKAPANTVIRKLNSLIDGLNGLEIPSWVPVIGGKKVNLKKINELATGGVLERGQMGLLEGNGAEAVVPLENNKKWIAAVTKDLKKSLKADGLLGGSTSITGATNTTYNYYQNNYSPKALSRLDIYRQTRNQLALANNGGAVNA